MIFFKATHCSKARYMLTDILSAQPVLYLRIRGCMGHHTVLDFLTAYVTVKMQRGY